MLWVGYTSNGQASRDLQAGRGPIVLIHKTFNLEVSVLKFYETSGQSKLNNQLVVKHQVLTGPKRNRDVRGGAGSSLLAEDCS